MSRRLNLNLDNIDTPKDPILSSGSMRDIVGHGVPPRWQPTISPKKLTVPGLQLDMVPFFDGFPFDGRVQPLRTGLKHFPTRHAEKEGLIGGGEVPVVTALEADDVG